MRRASSEAPTMLKSNTPTVTGRVFCVAGATLSQYNAVTPLKIRNTSQIVNGGSRDFFKSSTGSARITRSLVPLASRHSHWPADSGDASSSSCWQSASAPEALPRALSVRSPRNSSARPRSLASRTTKGPRPSASWAAASGGGDRSPVGMKRNAARLGTWSLSSNSTCFMVGSAAACVSATFRLALRPSDNASPVSMSQTSKASVTTPLLLSCNQPRRIFTPWSRKVSESTGSSSRWSGSRLSSTTVFRPSSPLTTMPPSSLARRSRYSSGRPS
mmetsp:Transcript_81782/g.231527  ORF Transcript_81782/g.231527 Transcript_81782/m.231527 type:complete len:274 (-) Transcript_81782:40-861(-)